MDLPETGPALSEGKRFLERPLVVARSLLVGLGASDRSRRTRSSVGGRIWWHLGAKGQPLHIPSIETDRLTLRPFVPEDVGRLAALLGDPIIMRYMPAREPLSRKDAEASLRRINMLWYANGCGRWAVVCNSDSCMIGWCGLEYLVEVDETEVLYLLDSAYWGKGFATEAAYASLRWGFEELYLDHIIGVAFPENVASRRVLEKTGCTYEGTRRISGCDMVQYTVSAGAFRPATGRYALRQTRA
jgi:ribosomal-protein-alanine N-acetyltransferase